METVNIISYIRQFYPVNSTESVAKALNLSPSKVRSLAKRYGITKCEKYKEGLKQQLIKNRRKWYKDNIPKFEPTHFQEQIIFGSLLGDGFISKGARRSLNYYYQEHFSENQRKYREWKLAKLYDLNFSISGNYLRSVSHPYFTEIYPELYPNGIKSLSVKFISQCNHPVFLSTLYLDDGSLTISYTHNKKTNTVYCHPSIILYTLNLTRKENTLLSAQLNKTFKTNFVVSGHPDGHKSLLKINKEQEVRYLLKVIEPFAKDIPSMSYKFSLEENIKQKTKDIQKKFGMDVNIVISSSDRKRVYSPCEIDKIIKWKTSGTTDQEIANKLERSYWSIVYKISDLRKQGLM